MKICLLQCNVRDGDLAANVEKITGMIRQAAGADLFIVPAQAISGPAWRTELPDNAFLKACREICQSLAGKLAQTPPLLCSLPYVHQGAILLEAGNVTYVSSDFYLGGGIKIALRNILAPVEGMAQCAADIIIDMDSSPFGPGFQELLEKRMAALALHTCSSIFSVNLVGGYGSQVYAGQSAHVNPMGRITARARSFAEDVLVVDIGSNGFMEEINRGRIEPLCASGEEAQWKALVLGVRDFVRKTGGTKAILGLSGGMDSAVVACIAAEALGSENVTGILMPSPYSSEGSIADSLDLAQNLGIHTYTVPIETMMNAFSEALRPVFDRVAPMENDLTLENLQARIRGALLMAIANRSGALVLNTGNRSELSMGYNTLYGDTVGALAVLGDIYKTRVYELARWYCGHMGKMVIPESIFTKAPSAELRPGQKDTDSLPPYDELDKVLGALLDNEDMAPSEISSRIGEIRHKILSSSFKRRQCPPALLVGRKY